MTEPQTKARRDAVRRFARSTFDLRGTWALHRTALGGDLVRAPVNVVLAPVFLLVRLAALAARGLKRHRLADWLAARRVLLPTRLSREVGMRVGGFIQDLEARGLTPQANPTTRDQAIAAYVATRSAVAEITTTLLVLLSGYLLFHSATPGLVSLAGPLADFGAQTVAIDRFPLGPGLGRIWYGMFPAALPVWMIVATVILLAVAAAFVTTFAGLIADPVQVATGTHRRRIERLLDRLAAGNGAEGLSREHVAARLGDIGDLAFSLIRFLRG